MGFGMFPEEQLDFIKVLHAWKARNPLRDLILLGGDLHMGMRREGGEEREEGQLLEKQTDLLGIRRKENRRKGAEESGMESWRKNISNSFLGIRTEIRHDGIPIFDQFITSPIRQHSPPSLVFMGMKKAMEIPEKLEDGTDFRTLFISYFQIRLFFSPRLYSRRPELRNILYTNSERYFSSKHSRYFFYAKSFLENSYLFRKTGMDMGIYFYAVTGSNSADFGVDPGLWRAEDY
jgi:hypothetical protein